MATVVESRRGGARRGLSTYVGTQRWTTEHAVVVEKYRQPGVVPGKRRQCGTMRKDALFT